MCFFLDIDYIEKYVNNKDLAKKQNTTILTNTDLINYIKINVNIDNISFISCDIIKLLINYNNIEIFEHLLGLNRNIFNNLHWFIIPICNTNAIINIIQNGYLSLEYCARIKNMDFRTFLKHIYSIDSDFNIDLGIYLCERFSKYIRHADLSQQLINRTVIAKILEYTISRNRENFFSNFNELYSYKCTSMKIYTFNDICEKIKLLKKYNINIQEDFNIIVNEFNKIENTLKQKLNSYNRLNCDIGRYFLYEIYQYLLKL